MMEDSALNLIIVILFFIMAGMVIALIFIPTYKYHGPNSNNVIRGIHTDKNGKCYRFGIYPIDCPKKFLVK